MLGRPEFRDFLDILVNLAWLSEMFGCIALWICKRYVKRRAKRKL